MSDLRPAAGRSTPPWFERHPAVTLSTLLAVLLLLLLGAVELGLRLVAPLPAGSTGYVANENGRRYGWGYSSHARVLLEDPDTGERFFARLNDHGWRDRDRRFENPTGAFRVLVIGDSNTFGVIVRDEQVFTRLLEERLRGEGYDAEVLNIGYSGWGTDQAVEALRLEGVRYRPHVVVLQFTDNDLADNVCHRRGPESARGRKPFFYELDRGGRLVRRDNPLFVPPVSSVRQRAIDLASRLEVWKRGDLLLREEHRSEPAAHRLSENQVLQIGLNLGLAPDAPLLQQLRALEGTALDPEALRALLVANGHAGDAEWILRVAEQRWFHEHWSPDRFDPAPVDRSRDEWRLYEALVAEARALAQGVGATLALYSDLEDGHYEWNVAWRRVRDTVAAREAYLEPTRVVRQIAAEQGIDFVENGAPYSRARNDSHPDARGNATMADDLYAYLLTRHGRALAARRSQARTAGRPNDRR